ncbi:MAG: hypothetical protein U1E17_02910 [Geminicoccaceae bacterium]
MSAGTGAEDRAAAHLDDDPWRQVRQPRRQLEAEAAPRRAGIGRERHPQAGRQDADLLAIGREDTAGLHLVRRQQAVLAHPRQPHGRTSTHRAAAEAAGPAALSALTLLATCKRGRQEDGIAYPRRKEHEMVKLSATESL